MHALTIWLAFCHVMMIIVWGLLRFAPTANIVAVQAFSGDSALYKVLYSRKFSRGRKFRDFRFLFSQKFLPLKTSCWRAEDAEHSVFDPQIQQIDRKFVVEPSSMDNIIPCVLCIEQTAEKIFVFATYDNSPVITATANRSSELAPSLWHGSSLPTATDTFW